MVVTVAKSLNNVSGIILEALVWGISVFIGVWYCDRWHLTQLLAIHVFRTYLMISHIRFGSPWWTPSECPAPSIKGFVGGDHWCGTIQGQWTHQPRPWATPHACLACSLAQRANDFARVFKSIFFPTLFEKPIYTNVPFQRSFGSCFSPKGPAAWRCSNQSNLESASGWCGCGSRDPCLGGGCTSKQVDAVKKTWCFFKNDLVFLALFPVRFSEWGFACWDLQRQHLVEPESQTLDISFLGVYHQDDHKHMVTSSETVAGRAMSQWWDVSGEAGPSTRPHSRFEEDPPTLNILSISNGELKILIQVLSMFW